MSTRRPATLTPIVVATCCGVRASVHGSPTRTDSGNGWITLGAPANGSPGDSGTCGEVTRDAVWSTALWPPSREHATARLATDITTTKRLRVFIPRWLRVRWSPTGSQRHFLLPARGGLTVVACWSVDAPKPRCRRSPLSGGPKPRRRDGPAD